MSRKKFTLEKAIAIQTEQLNGWKGVLLPEVFETLKKFATRDNHLINVPDSIIRGSNLSVIVSNIINRNIPLITNDETRLVELTVTSYYSKQVIVKVSIPKDIDEDDIQDFLTEDEEIDALVISTLNESNDLIEDETKWEYHVPSLKIGGTL